MKNTGSHIGYLRFGSNAESRKANGKQNTSDLRVSYLYRSGTDAEVIATLTAISQVSAKMAKNLRIIATHRQSEEGGIVNVKNER